MSYLDECNRLQIILLLGIAIAIVGSYVFYGLLKKTVSIRLSEEEKFNSAKLSFHKISATPECESGW